MEISFCSLKSKCVINISDGKNLGNITDVIIDTCTSKVLAIVVPTQSKNFFNIFKSNNNIIIPYNHICKIGEDTILVDIIMQNKTIQNNSISTLSKINNEIPKENNSDTKHHNADNL
jgi:YlmC/YmxH family sporulation protein